MSIQETWEAVARCFLWHEQPTAVLQQQTRNEQILVRAVMMAVLEAMMPPRGHSGPKTALERRYLAVRASIDSLGNEEG
jgi:hypothetical protein